MRINKRGENSNADIKEHTHTHTHTHRERERERERKTLMQIREREREIVRDRWNRRVVFKGESYRVVKSVCVRETEREREKAWEHKRRER